jgi:hypothetical protein
MRKSFIKFFNSVLGNASDVVLGRGMEGSGCKICYLKMSDRVFFASIILPSP